MNKKSIFSIIAGVIALIVIVTLLAGGVAKNDAQNWQHVQYPNGSVSIRDKAGWYPKWFATVSTYPRYVDKTWNDIVDEGEQATQSTRTTFNDGGTAQVETYVRYMTPSSIETRKSFHQQFAGNIENATVAVKAHQINCVKATGPLMSASENQSARKAEFTQLIWDQLENGLYKMKRISTEIEVDDEMALLSTDSKMVVAPSKTKEVTITTELVRDADGNPLIAKTSPLEAYDIKIMQFSVTGITYDDDTLTQFATKKLAYLAAEQSKADREMEKQERLNIIEKGLREVAEAQAAGNVAKETAVVAAQLKAEVAMQAKLEAETIAAMALSVAKLDMEKAQVKLDTSKLDAQAIIELAKAEQEKIRLAGALTELEQALIDAKVLMADAVSKNLAQIPVPAIVMGGGDGKGASQMENLINIKLMTDSGIMKMLGIDKNLVERSIDRTKK